MDYQLLAVALIVVAAFGYLARRAWRTWAGRKSGCGGGCSCGPKEPVNGQISLIPPEQLTLRRRSGPL